MRSERIMEAGREGKKWREGGRERERKYVCEKE